MDLNVNAFRIVKHLTEENSEEKRRSATKQIGGKLGGPARAKKLTPERRREIAIKASKARWSG
jgi:hypothetical protein